MRRRDSGLIDMTPLLDVVFILLFALIINVNVNRAEDQALIDAQEAVIAEERTKAEEYQQSAEQASLKEEALRQERLISDRALEEAVDENASLSTDLATATAELERKEALLTAYEEAMQEALDREIDEEEDPELKEWLQEISDGDIVLEEWMRFQQIAERYLFVDMTIRASDGRVYINDDYTGIRLDHGTATDSELRSEAVRELQLYIVDWLDHKEGGYSFVFVTVVEDGAITRAVAQAAFDSLQGLQITFEKDYYMVNRFVREKR